MKLLSKIVFILYLLTLLWLVLFKFSYDLAAILLHYQTRGLNLIPFVGLSGGTVRETIDNFIVFVPFGLLLRVCFQRATRWQNLMVVCLFSLTIEVLQYVFAIGVTDITDLVTNTLGGLAGLMVYDLGAKYLDGKNLDRFIVVAGGMLLVALILWRVLVLHVRY